MEKPTGSHPKRAPIIGKEVFVGIVSILLGGYSLLQELNIIHLDIQAPNIVANSLLVLGGFFLLGQAYKLFRHEWHLKSII